ncbi:hypothetical protein [Parasphingorhabdus cellanae]|uniref:Uncharacterized protein n=1 Tax=Parasphingorhabdus cellanae TaxID=2806553 RepID=A0ABX7T3B4_9SPHN|nr:hypothetical protein [Parasphingorhabdus cellanae]QTD55443.1 hypothetical protein J4G78_14710 [Parasphingorhabdus cellanae]
MKAGRTTLSFLDLALMLLSAFAYAHFVNLADPETRETLSQTAVIPSSALSTYNYASDRFFGASNAMLTDEARQEIAKIMSIEQNKELTISVPALPETAGGARLRQWEMVAARSAAIADAFEVAGQAGDMIVLKMPEKLVSGFEQSKEITLSFQKRENVLLNDGLKK